MSVTLISGVNELSNDSFVGRNIEQIIRETGHLLNIPSENLTILINDRQTSDRGYVLQHGDRVEFVKASGEKGAR
jgi:hypothetical protein